MLHITEDSGYFSTVLWWSCGKKLPQSWIFVSWHIRKSVLVACVHTCTAIWCPLGFRRLSSSSPMKKVGSLFAFTLECSIERYFWYVESDFLQITHHRPNWQTRQGLGAKAIGTISNARTGRNWNVVHSHRLLCARSTADSCALAAACLDNT